MLTRGRGRRRTETTLPSVTVHDPEVMKKIADTAYALWEKRGRPDGGDLQDWLEAERIVLGRNQVT